MPSLVGSEMCIRDSHTAIQLWDSSPPEPLSQPAQNPPDLLPFLDDADLPLPFIEEVPPANPDNPAAPNELAAPNPEPVQNPVLPAEDPPVHPVIEQPGAVQPDPQSPSVSDQSADEAGMTTAPSSPVEDTSPLPTASADLPQTSWRSQPTQSTSSDSVSYTHLTLPTICSV